MDTPETIAPKAFDLSAYELADTGTMTVKDKKGADELLGNDKKPVTIELYSPGSDEGVKAQRRFNFCQQMRTTRMLRGELDKKDAVEAERELAEKLAGFTKRISDNFPVSPLNLYLNPKLGYITRQVMEYLGKESNF